MSRDRRSAYLRELKRHHPALAEAFERALQDVKSSAQMHAIEAAIDRGDFEAVVRALQLGPEFFAPLDRLIGDVFIAGGAYALAGLPKKPLIHGRTGPLIVRFQGRHPRAEAWIREVSSRLIREINDSTREAIREVLVAGVRDGRNPRQVALDLVGRIEGNARVGGIVGLTGHEAQAILNKRAQLLAGGMGKHAITDQLRDLTNQALLRRGERIARTETIGALNAGRYEGFEQLIETGQVARDQISVKWSATLDSRTRDIHRAMHGRVVTFGEVFRSPSGAGLRFPGDRQHGARGGDVINCRCFAQISVNWLSMAA